MQMPAFFNWIAQHWLAVSIVFIAALALAFVITKRKSLFYKE